MLLYDSLPRITGKRVPPSCHTILGQKSKDQAYFRTQKSTEKFHKLGNLAWANFGVPKDLHRSVVTECYCYAT